MPASTSSKISVPRRVAPAASERSASMAQAIQRNWNGQQEVTGQTLVRFVITRDGRITEVTVENPSGYFALDRAAESALLVTRQLPPLPAQYTGNELAVHLIFRYGR